jgi:hypothetical protein
MDVRRHSPWLGREIVVPVWIRAESYDSRIDASIWRPDRGIAQAFEVMRAKPEWRWLMTEYYDPETVAVGVRSVNRDFPAIYFNVPAEGNIDQAWRTAILRCALLAVQET